MTDTLRILTGYGSIDLLNPVADDVNMRDVCVNLSRIRRWNGTIDFTVGQHSDLAAMVAKQKGCNDATCFATLIHDAHEYATNDIAGPLLDHLRVAELIDYCPNGNWKTTWSHRMKSIQQRIQDSIHFKCDLAIADVDFNAVHAADMEARAAEIHWLLPESPKRTELMVKYPEPNEGTRQAFLKAQGADLDTLVGLLRFYGVSV